MKLKDVAFVKPGGNDTAIVFDKIARIFYAKVGTQIQLKYPNIEQVMFVEKGKHLATRGQMVGGEFCGNATRAYAYVIAGGVEGALDVEVSGSKDLLAVHLTATSSRAAMPIISDFEAVKLLEKNLYQVHLEGISYIVARPDHPIALSIVRKKNDNQKKREARKVLDQYGLSQGPACGVIILKQNHIETAIEPFVYVRDAETMYYETACGSGSTAAALVISHESKNSVVALPILQPSGMNLVLDIDRSETSYLSAYVGGCVEIMYRGPLNLSQQYNE